jgi:hypothetical protein
MYGKGTLRLTETVVRKWEGGTKEVTNYDIL